MAAVGTHQLRAGHWSAAEQRLHRIRYGAAPSPAALAAPTRAAPRRFAGCATPRGTCCCDARPSAAPITGSSAQCMSNTGYDAGRRRGLLGLRFPSAPEPTGNAPALDRVLGSTTTTTNSQICPLFKKELRSALHAPLSIIIAKDL